MAIQASSLHDTREAMKERLSGIVPDFEIHSKAELVFEINRIKQERNAIILGHNYMEPALYHTVPDVVGDSLELARKAADTDQDPIVFCGVHFMAETAKILNPDKLVLLPAKKAGCSLAESITAEDVRALRTRYPGVPVVTYINTYADVKAETDVCCTSGNAAAIVEALDSDTVIFIPDEFLAGNVARETSKRIIFPVLDDTSHQADDALDYELIGWRGRCEVHEKYTVEDIKNARAQFPEVEILAHPECSPEVVAASDFSGSTSKMISHVKQCSSKQILLLTECSMGDNIAAENRDKEMIRLCSVRCPHMNEITLEDTLNALRHDRYPVEVEETIRVKAKQSIDRMLAMS